MSNFNSLVLEVATIILILCLLLIGWAIWNEVYGKKAKFPPVIGTCPDYWTAEPSYNDTNTMSNNSDNPPYVTCTNTYNLGDSNNCKSIYTGNIPHLCDKLKWANTCKVSWEGITDNKNNVSISNCTK